MNTEIHTTHDPETRDPETDANAILNCFLEDILPFFGVQVTCIDLCRHGSELPLDSEEARYKAGMILGWASDLYSLVNDPSYYEDPLASTKRMLIHFAENELRCKCRDA